MMAFMNSQQQQGKCKVGQVQDMARGLAWFTNQQLEAGGKRIIKELVVSLPGIKTDMKKAKKAASKMDRENNVDLQFGFTDALTASQKEGLGSVGMGHSAAGLSTPLAAARTDADIKILSSLGARAGDLRSLRMTKK